MANGCTPWARFCSRFLPFKRKENFCYQPLGSLGKPADRGGSRKARVAFKVLNASQCHWDAENGSTSTFSFSVGKGEGAQSQVEPQQRWLYSAKCSLVWPPRLHRLVGNCTLPKPKMKKVVDPGPAWGIRLLLGTVNYPDEVKFLFCFRKPYY